MSKLVLQKILTNSESPVPKTVLITDSVDACGRGVLYALLKSHLSLGNHVFYLTTTQPPHAVKTFIKDEELPTKVEYFDGYSDPSGWEGIDSCVALGESLQQIFQCNDNTKNKKKVFVIDKLDDVLNHQESLNVIRSLHMFSADENVEQLVIYCSRDCIPESVTAAVCHIASAVIHIQNKSPCCCNVILRKPSGKLLKSHEEFTLSPDLRLQESRAVEKDSAPPSENSDADAILAAHTTFNLSLTEDQRKSKNMLLLPHTRVQSSGGQIHYTPDDEDDWDEEDPDDDLDI